MNKAETILRTPLSTRLSGSAKEAELRIRNIFQWKKKRPPLWAMVLTALVILSCGSLVSCQVRDTGEEPPAAPLSAAELSPDLNQNGVPEEVRLVEGYWSPEVQFFENGQLLLREIPDVWLCTLEGTDYILCCSLDEYQGSFRYSYYLSEFSGEFEETVQWGWLTFDTNFGAPFHKDFDPEAIAAFVDEVNALLAHSLLLTERDGALAALPAQAVELEWLDGYPAVFARDPEKPLLETLQDFQRAMEQAREPAPPAAAVDALPFDHPLALTFASGVGAWYTGLELRPDGSFTGDYTDADGSTRYVCQFHGTFRDFRPLSASSWLLTLEELVLDTKYPVGTEWDEGPWHYVSSGPSGFSDVEGNALRPGAQFVLYAPEARGDAPGTELYGAEEFLSWWPGRYSNDIPSPLGCYGLHNLSDDIGFFS